MVSACLPSGRATGETHADRATAQAAVTSAGIFTRASSDNLRDGATMSLGLPIGSGRRGDVAGVRLARAHDDRVVVALDDDVQVVADGRGRTADGAGAR